MDRKMNTRGRKSFRVLAAVAWIMLAIAALASAALAAPSAEVVQQREAAQQARQNAASQRRQAREQAAAVRRQEREATRAQHQRRPARSATSKEISEYGWVEIGCGASGTTATWHFRNFPAVGVNTVKLTLYVYGDAVTPEPGEVQFTGSEYSVTTPFHYAFGKLSGYYRVDTLAQWRNSAGGEHGSFDVTYHPFCEAESTPHGSFEILKLQSVVGAPTGFVRSPIEAHVGDKIEYEIVVSNTGGTVITFTPLTDANCEGLRGGEPSGMLQPKGFEKFICTHTVTQADLEAGTYLNTASVTGTPNGEAPITSPSNTVEAKIVKPAEKQAENPNPNGNGGNQGSSTGTTTANDTGSSTGTTTGQQGSLAATAASVPVISGAPQGCVRGSFLVRIHAKGVRSVVIYIDGHRIKTLTARSARHGLFTLRVNTNALKVGRHRLKATITMEATAASKKRVSASRSFAFLRCASAAVVHPKFTG